MAVIHEIPLTADNQKFNITLKGVVYRMQVLWRGNGWFLDIAAQTGEAVISGLPLVSGYDLLKQYAWLELGFALHVVCDAEVEDNPTQSNLGTLSHLFVITE